MDMKSHILTALREQIERWEALLSGLSEAQISTPLLPSDWTVKDVMAHLMTWQQRSIARVEAALHGREPDFTGWPASADSNAEDTTDQVNAWIYETHRDQPWSKVHQDWSAGFQRLLESAGGISERDLLDSSRYPWLSGYPMAYILLATYDHHQEHYEKVVDWLGKHR